MVPNSLPYDISSGVVRALSYDDGGQVTENAVLGYRLLDSNGHVIASSADTETAVVIPDDESAFVIGHDVQAWANFAFIARCCNAHAAMEALLCRYLAMHAQECRDPKLAEKLVVPIDCLTCGCQLCVEAKALLKHISSEVPI